MSLRCRDVRRWLANGETSTSDRLRLEEHLQSCPRCAERAEILGGVVALLRDDTHDPSAARLDRIWQRVEAGAREASPGPSPLRPRWIREDRSRQRLGFGLAAAATLLVALAVGVLWSSDRDGAPAPAVPALARQAAVQGSGSQAPPVAKQAKPVVASDRRARSEAFDWQIVTSERLREGDTLLTPHTGVRPRQLLTTGAKGRAVLASKRELLLVMASTRLKLSADGREVLLLEGTIAIQTRDVTADAATKRRAEVRVRAGDVTIEPVGTLFAVRLVVGKAPEVSVLDGKVALRGPADGLARAAIELPAGQALRWGSKPQRISATLRRELSSLARLAAGEPKTRSPKVDLPVRSRPAIARAGAQELAAAMRSIKASLASGAHGKARAEARRWLRRPGAARKAPMLLTLIAESYAASATIVTRAQPTSGSSGVTRAMLLAPTGSTWPRHWPSISSATQSTLRPSCAATSAAIGAAVNVRERTCCSARRCWRAAQLRQREPRRGSTDRSSREAATGESYRSCYPLASACLRAKRASRHAGVAALGCPAMQPDQLHPRVAPARRCRPRL
jgi:hypothetical protein